jgi:flagella basal body P-ring formation protein FlgA
MSRISSMRTRGHKNTRIFVACALMSCSLFCGASANSGTSDLQSDSALRVYLPREVTVDDSRLSLGRVSIIRGSESLVARASEITLGRISVPGQKITIDRPMVLSRLACNGIAASQVTLTGAEKVTVEQRQQIISSGAFVTLASSFLAADPRGASACQWDPMRKPKDFIIPGTGKDIRFSPRLVRGSAKNQAKVEIAVLSGDEKIGQREVSFGLKYDRRQVITKVDIPAGGIISTENVKIETAPSDYPEPADWKSPYGLTARRRLTAKTVLRPNMVGPLKSPIIVKRNQNVVIRIEKPGFVVTAIGKTIQDGRAGEYIKVRNVDSQRIILVRINEDGSVEPAS